MGLTQPAQAAEYAASIRFLFPLGDFWDAEFSDPESPLSRWCETKAAELVEVKNTLAKLVPESNPLTSVQLISDWERAFGVDNRALALTERRSAILAHSATSFHLGGLEALVAAFGASLVKAEFPYKPLFCGFGRFRSRMATPAAFHTLWIILVGAAPEIRANLEAAVKRILPVYYIESYFYGV